MQTDADRFNSALGRQLRAEIAAGGSSIARMARDVDVARSTLDNYVTGARAIPATVVYDICQALAIPVADVIRRADERYRSERAGDELAVRRRDVGGHGQDRKVAHDADQRDRGGDDGEG